MNVSLLNLKHISFPFIIISILFLFLHFPFQQAYSTHKSIFHPSLLLLIIVCNHRHSKRKIRDEDERKRIVHVSESFFIPWILCIQPEFLFLFIAVDVKNDLPLISSLTGKFNFFSYFLSIAFKNCWYHFSLFIHFHTHACINC